MNDGEDMTNQRIVMENGFKVLSAMDSSHLNGAMPTSSTPQPSSLSSLQMRGRARDPHFNGDPSHKLHSRPSIKSSSSTAAKANTTTGRNGCRQTKRSPSERRFKCEQSACDRMFFTRKDVKRHMVVHTGIRNFACPFCQQRFGRKDHLVRHAKKSHNRDTRTSATSYPFAQGSVPYGSKAQSQLLASHAGAGMVPNPSHHHHALHAHHHHLASAQFSHHGSAHSLAHGLGGSGGGPPAAHSHHSMHHAAHHSLASSHHHGGNNDGSSPLLTLGPAHGNPNGYNSLGLSSLIPVSRHNMSQHEVADHLGMMSLGQASSSSSNGGHGTGVSSSVKNEPSSSTGSSHYFSFPVPTASPFVSSSLMSNWNNTRGLYSPPGGPGAFNPVNHGISSLSVACGDHGPSPVGPMGFTVENSGLPHFSQAFQ